MRYERKTKRAPSRYHQAFMAAYYAAREADEQARDAAVGIYGPGSTEWAEYPHHTMITFKKWLIAMSGQRASDPEPEETPTWSDSEQNESLARPTSVTSVSAGSLNSRSNLTSSTPERAA